jgi:Carboxypeptidase regulatory-like domain
METLVRSLICISLILLSASAPDSKKGKLSGTVRDSEGAIISGAIVIVHWSSSGSDVGLEANVGLSEDLHLETDKLGAYSVDVSPSFYDVFISAVAFSPSCRNVRVRSDTTVAFSPKLKVDPGVSKETD